MATKTKPAATATAVQPLKTALMTVYHDSRLLRLTSQGGKQLIVELGETDDAGLTSDEQAVLYAVMDGKAGSPYQLDVPIADLHVLVGVRDKCKAHRDAVKGADRLDEERAHEVVADQVAKAVQDGVPANGRRTTMLPVNATTTNGRARPTTGEVKTAADRTVAEQAGMAKGRLSRGARVADEQERRVTGLQRCLERCKDGFVMVSYDIPSDLDKECPNPSSIFWRHMGRFQLSCWYTTPSEVEHPDVQEVFARWRRFAPTAGGKGVKFWVVRQHPDETATIRGMVLAELEDEIRKVHTSLIATIAAADAWLAEIMAEEGVTQRTMQAAQNIHDCRVRVRINTAYESLNLAICCAEKFDATEEVEPLLKGLRAAVLANAQAFDEMARRKRLKLSDVALNGDR